MSYLFAEQLSSILYDQRPGMGRTAEDLQEMTGVSKWRIYKWANDENTETINSADHLARTLDGLGDNRLVKPRICAQTTLLRLSPTLVDGCINKEKDAIICALQRVIDAFPANSEKGLQACEAGINAFIQLREEFQRLK